MRLNHKLLKKSKVALLEQEPRSLIDQELARKMMVELWKVNLKSTISLKAVF